MRLNFISMIVRGDESLTDVVCLGCKHKNRMDTAAAQRLLASFELLRQNCPNCNAPYCHDTAKVQPVKGPLDNEFVKFGKTVAVVLSHRGEADDMELDANIGFILLDKEQRTGLASFSNAERHVYAVQAMSREVNNGGFDQFFYNGSGALAFDLVPALEAMGSVENLALAKQAVERFGKPSSLNDDDRAAHLSTITNDGDANLWDDLDSKFYENPEDLEKLVLDYIELNCDAFDS